MKIPLYTQQRLIISLYDYTGEWARPYIDAGYPVMPWDKKHEGDIVKNRGRLIGEIENAIDAGYTPMAFYLRHSERIRTSVF